LRLGAEARQDLAGWVNANLGGVNILIPRMSKCFDGPAPTISVKLLMPTPINSHARALLELIFLQSDNLSCPSPVAALRRSAAVISQSSADLWGNCSGSKFFMRNSAASV
jgi:hypothetical protein